MKTQSNIRSSHSSGSNGYFSDGSERPIEEPVLPVKDRIDDLPTSLVDAGVALRPYFRNLALVEFGKSQARLKAKRQMLADEKSKLAAEEAAIERNISSAKESNESGSRKYSVSVIAAALGWVFLLFGTWWNAAGFAVDHTQDWVRAFLFCFCLPAIPLAYKTLIDGLSIENHLRVRFWIGIAMVVASVVFVGSFAQRFAKEETLTLDGSFGGNDMRLQMASQLLLEVSIGCCLAMFIERKVLGAGPGGQLYRLKVALQECRFSLKKLERRIGKTDGQLMVVSSRIEIATTQRTLERIRNVSAVLFKN